MSPKSKVQSSKLWSLIFVCLLLSAICQSACSIPNLESKECTEARNAVREFYSFHFGNDMKLTKENLQQREKFLSGKLKQELEKQPESATDYFTATDDYPKAFRIGNCEEVETDKKVNLQVVLFWKSDTRSEQKEVHAEVVKDKDEWLVNKIETK